VARLPGSVKPGSANLCEADKLLWLAQDPNQPDPFYADKVEYFYKIPNKNMTETLIVDPARLNQKDEHAWDDAYVFLWARPNVTYKKKIIGFIPAENKIVFDKAGEPYRDREELYSLVNALPLLDKPGEYVVRAKPESDGRVKAFLWPYDEADVKGGAVTVSVRGVGVTAVGTRYVTVQGLRIQKYSGAVQFDRAGIGVSAGNGPPTSHLVVRNNLITHLRHADRGYGGVYLDNARDCLIEGNEITECPLSMGILVGGSTGIVTKGNRVRKAGGQNIWYMGCKDSKIVGNEVRDGQGTHANGISVYSKCDGVEVFGNRVFDSNIPFTFEDSQNVTIACNIFDGGGVNWVCVCWGGMNHVKIFNNLFINAGDGGGLVIRNPAGDDWTVKNNILSGFAAKPAWNVGNNIFLGKAAGQGPLGKGELRVAGPNELFVDAARGDYRLKPGSPAIDAGVDVGLKEDIVGGAVPAGRAPDIGPYEFGAESAK
jgi:parallel beta-helix repeat protein